jgi:hypothetical protein
MMVLNCDNGKERKKQRTGRETRGAMTDKPEGSSYYDLPSGLRGEEKDYRRRTMALVLGYLNRPVFTPRARDERPAHPDG